MQRLIEAGLRFGGLLYINEHHLVERYNRALKAFNLPPTKQSNFYIDASGFSHEVADEIGDFNYLDPQGVNRRFIILSPDQMDIPLARTHFSADKDLLQRFFRANDHMIRNVTLKDALYGEIDNLVYNVKEPRDILMIRDIMFHVRTPTGIIEKATYLQSLIERFNSEPTPWRDQSLMNTIVDHASQCGDIRKNGFHIEKNSFTWPSIFWTSHFGGTFVLHDPDGPILIGNPQRLTPLPDNASLISKDETMVLMPLLSERALIDPFDPEWLLSSGFLDHRLRQCVVKLLIKHDPSFTPEAIITETYLNSWIAPSITVLEADEYFQALSTMRSLIATKNNAIAFEKSLPAHLRLLFRRANPDSEGAADINRLLVHHCPFDLLTLYIFDEQEFFRRYNAFDENLKSFAIAYLRHYYPPKQDDTWRKRAKLRQHLFSLI